MLDRNSYRYSALRAFRIDQDNLISFSRKSNRRAAISRHQPGNFACNHYWRIEMRTITNAAQAILFTVLVTVIVIGPGTYAAYQIT